MTPFKPARFGAAVFGARRFGAGSPPASALAVPSLDLHLFFAPTLTAPSVAMTDNTGE